MKLKDLINNLLKIYNEHGDIPVKHYSGNVCSYNDIESNDVKCVVHESDLENSWNFVSGEKFVCIGEEVTENYLVTEFSEECEKDLVELLKLEINNLSKNTKDTK